MRFGVVAGPCICRRLSLRGRGEPKCLRPGVPEICRAGSLALVIHVYSTMVHEVCTTYVFMRPPPRLRLLFHDELEIFLRRRRPPRLARRVRTV